MARRKRLPVWIVLAAFAIYVVWSGGGLFFENRDDFGGQRDITLSDGLQSDIWLSPGSQEAGLPLLFHYRRTGGPYGLRLQIWDKGRQYRSIEIAEVLVEYDNGDALRRATPWIKDLQPYSEYGSSSPGRSQTEMLMLNDQIPRLVWRHQDLKITLTGHLVRRDGQRVSFRASEQFKAESLNRAVTFWDVISSC